MKRTLPSYRTCNKRLKQEDSVAKRINIVLKQPYKTSIFLTNNKTLSVISGTVLLFVAAIDIY